MQPLPGPSKGPRHHRPEPVSAGPGLCPLIRGLLWLAAVLAVVAGGFLLLSRWLSRSPGRPEVGEGSLRSLAGASALRRPVPPDGTPYPSCGPKSKDMMYTPFQTG